MTQQNDLGAIQVSGQTEMALADEIDAALTTFLNAPSPFEKMVARTNLTNTLWDNKAGIVAALRRPAPTEPDIRAALEALREIEALDEQGRYGRLAREALAALSTAGDTGREEPVAWRWRTRAEDNWTFSVARLSLNDIGRTASTYEEEPLYASPQPAARIGREIAQTIYQSWFDSDPQTVEEHFRWYANGKSNPDSCVHYSNVAKAIKAADAILSLTASAPAGGCTVPRAHGKTGISALGDSDV